MTTGKLYCTESGQMMAACNEEITRWTHARKRFELGADSDCGTLWLFCYEYCGNTLPLRVVVAGRELLIEPDPSLQGQYFWRRLDVPGPLLRAGPLEVTISSDADRDNAWILGLDVTCASIHSRKSFDGGRTWRSDAMGFNFALTGEYMARLWVSGEAEASEPVEFVWEDPAHPRLRHLREALGLDEVIAGASDEVEAKVALRSWVAGQWVWSCGGDTKPYPPWDALTILDWATTERGHGFVNTIRFCVHFGTVYTQCAMALGWPAKCVVLGPPRVGKTLGHYISEVWIEQLGKWVVMDASQDCHFERGGQLLSALDVHRLWAAGRSEELTTVRGPNWHLNPMNREGFMDKGLAGGMWGNFGALPRNDYFTSPHAFPLEHGSYDYHETHFVWWKWHKADVDRLVYMPRHSDREGDLYPEVPEAWRPRGR